MEHLDAEEIELAGEPPDEGLDLYDGDRGDAPGDLEALDALDAWRPAEAAGLLVLDIDGTIVDGMGVLDAAVVDAVAIVQAAGVRVALATGRSPWSGVDDLVSVLGLTGPQITMHGALVVEPHGGDLRLARALPASLYLEAIRLADELGLDPVVATAQGHRAERLPEWIGIRSAGGPEGRAFRYVPDLAALAETPAFRVYLPTGPGRHQAVRRAYVERLGERATVLWTDTSGVEVLAPGVDKGNAVEWLAASMALPMHRVCAVGDARNDIGMLLRAGKSAAMAGAPEEVRRAADIVVPPVEAHGVVAALRWFYPGIGAGLDRLAATREIGAYAPVLPTHVLGEPGAAVA